MKAVETVRFRVLDVLNSGIWYPCRSGQAPINNFLVIGPASPKIIDEGIQLAMKQYALIPHFPDSKDMSKVEYVKDEKKPELTFITIEASDVMNEGLMSSLPFNGEGPIEIESDPKTDVENAENKLGFGVLYIRNVTAQSSFPSNFLYNLSKHHMYNNKAISSKWLIILGFSDKAANLRDLRIDGGQYVNMNNVED